MRSNKAQLVREYISQEVEAGRIRSGQRLPSCRDLGAALRVNKLTVNRAYKEMESEHKVYSIPRGGFYLVGAKEDLDPVQKAADFRNVRPDDKLLPYREFTHVINQVVEKYRNSLFAYDNAEGLPALRETLKTEFAQDGIYTKAEGIVITHGAQQALTLVLMAIFNDRRGKLLVEAPTYSLALQLAHSLGIAVAGIERNSTGYDFRALEALFGSGEIRAFYVIPRHHNPTGYSLAERDKQKLAELAGQYNVLLIEDDYLAGLGSRKGSLPIYYYDTSQRTAYIRSFSKTFMPGLRIGAAVLPDSLMTAVSGFKHLSDLNTSPLLQAALNLFIQSGMYAKHIQRVRDSYTAKLRKAAEIFQDLSPQGLTWHVPRHGIFIWMQLPEGIGAGELERQLEERGILVQAAGECFPETWEGKRGEGRPDSCLRLCITAVPMEQICSLAEMLSIIRDFA